MKKIDHQLTRKKNAPVKHKTKLKTAISIRLDPDIVRHFKAGGSMWQGRINQALLDHIADIG